MLGTLCKPRIALRIPSSSSNPVPHNLRTSRRTLASTMVQQRIANPALFICDLQEKFRPAIYEFPKVVATAQKLLNASQILNIPVFATTQNRARLGETCPELKLDAPGGIKTVCHVDKTLFSMITPEVQKSLDSLNADGPLSCIIVGIESHICVTQTTVDLLKAGHKVYIIADGVSSCNKEEVPIALTRLRHAGAIVTTSESFIYECVGDAGTAEFKEIIKVIKETSSSTRETLQTLCKI
ncbi:isochorismatase domain-containing protein 2A, mitochondrial precursor [Plenodomus tracheiphilus IPT5]|uniref:Isochorismatase domain-containing protein 2A, mitochondrial n=1 Tax=Plenodomus tracheiphilus IPT5 TaxID=1408161 RepID=A0A6A7BAU8_9PLEO|nr:isochorismatase domain-containing protein 2A, mitochondrial precursor [Plenodomus tracheiphilus IPT5]